MLKLNDADDKSTGYKSKATPFLDALGLLGNPRKPRPKNSGKAKAAAKPAPAVTADLLDIGAAAQPATPARAAPAPTTDILDMQARIWDGCRGGSVIIILRYT